MKRPSILLVFCDPYLAGIYGRKFEMDDWDVRVEETLEAAERTGAAQPPDILLLETDCVADPVAEVKRLRSLPTLLQTKIVLVTKQGDRHLVKACMDAGANDMLFFGHFVPREAVEKMRRLQKNGIL